MHKTSKTAHNRFFIADSFWGFCPLKYPPLRAGNEERTGTCWFFRNIPPGIRKNHKIINK
jgi:hypothetical protein